MKQSEYMIIQFAPDPLTEERINVGVVAFDSQAVECRFLHNWHRVRCFAGEEIEFLKDFADHTSRRLAKTFPLDEGGINDLGVGRAITPELLTRMSKEWEGAIQFTTARPSTRHRTEVLEWAVKRLLVDSPGPRAPRSIADSKVRDDMLRMIKRQAKQLLLPESAESLVRYDEPWQGKVEQHSLKASLTNGHQMAGFDALSMSNIERGSVHAARLKWALSDIRHHGNETPIVITVYPPRDNMGEFRSLLGTFRSLGGTPVAYDEAEGYIAEVIGQSVSREHKLLPARVADTILLSAAP